MGQKWSKAQHKKYSETMKAKRKQRKVVPNGADSFPDPFLGKWNDYTNLMFSSLPIEQKLEILSKVKL
jgi:hypothetical protein